MLRKGKALPYQVYPMWILVIIAILVLVIGILAITATSSSYAELIHLDDLALTTSLLMLIPLHKNIRMVPVILTARAQRFFLFFNPPKN
jgi:hypothetical protein